MANPPMPYALLLSLLLLAAGGAKSPSGAPIVPKPGPNVVDLDGDGTPDLIVKARRENFDAHSSTHYAFYRKASAGAWEIVPIEVSPTEPLQIDFSTSEGADCILRDVRLHRAKDGRIELVVATREFGESYADTKPVTFAWFALAHNDEEVPGRPPFYFAKKDERVTATPYCDVEMAFEKELPAGR
jgi:hypothetical protein